MRACEWLLLATLSIFWGGSFFFVEVALGIFHPLLVVFGRVGIAAIALIAFLHFRGSPLPASWRDWRSLFAMAFLNNIVPFTLIAYGQLHIDSGLASIFNATTPLFTVLLAHLCTRDEKLTAPKLLGVGLGITGVVVLIGPRALLEFDPESLAQVAVLVAALSYASAGIYGRRLNHLPNVVAAAGMLAASTLMMLPIAVIAGAPFVPGPTTIAAAIPAMAAVLGLALLSTSVAYVIYFRLLATVGATNLLLVTFLIPISAIFLGGVFLGERPDTNTFVGMALIFAGLAAVDGRLFAQKHR